GGPAWNAPIPGANGFATGTFFTLKSARFDEDSLTLIGMGTTQLTSGDPLVQKNSPARIVIQGTGQDFTYNLTVVTTAVPEGGSGLGLLGIGLVAVEGLRRKASQRGSAWILSNRLSVTISPRPPSPYSTALSSHSNALSASPR